MIYGFDLDEFITVVYECGVLLFCSQSFTIYAIKAVIRNIDIKIVRTYCILGKKSSKY